MNNFQQNENNPNNQTIYPNQQPVSPTQQNQQPINPVQPPKKPNNVLIVSIVGVAAVLVVICAIIAAYNAGKGQNTGGSYVGPAQQNTSQTNFQNQGTGETEANVEKAPASEPAPDTPVTTPAETASSAYSRKNPAPVGVEQILNYVDEYDETDNFTVAVKILETIRGEAALAKLKEVNSYNDPADEGYEYVLARISISLIAMNDEKAFDASPFDFTSFTSSNEELSSVYVVDPKPELDGKLYEGASTEGWATFQVKVGDPAPKLAYKLNYDGSGGIWFALQ